MITEFIVKVNGQNVYLDTLDELPISLNYNIADINKIESKNSSYSKTITLPDSKVNREAFEHIFQLNSDSSFDITKKSRCWILKDTVVQFEGNLQLTNITYDNNFNMNGYEVVIYSDNDTLYKNIGEAYLTDLNLSSYDHKFTYQNVIYSFTQSYDNGYYYPLIDYAGDLTRKKLRDGFFKITDMYPATYAKAIVDQIFIEAGYGYTSDFFNSPEWKRLIIPFSNKQYQPTIYNLTTDSDDKIFIANLSATVSMTLTQSYTTYWVDWNSFNHNIDTYDPNGRYDNTNFVYRKPVGASSISESFRIDLDIYSPLQPYTVGQPATPAGTWWTGNNDDIRIVVKRSFDVNTGTTASGWDNTPTFAQIQSYSSGGWPEITFNSLPSYSIRSEIVSGTAGNIIQTLSGTVFNIKGAIYTDELVNNPLLDNEEVRFFVYRSWIYNPAYYSPVVTSTYTKIGTQSTISSSVDRTKTPIGGDIRLQDNLPANVKQKDFLSSIIKMFNLYMEPEKDKANSFIIEPRDDYYRKYQVVKDWSRKLDVSKSITSIFTTNQQSRSNLFTYKEDKDFYNTDYNNNTKKIFGEYRYDIDNDFIKGENKIELIFSPTIDDKVTYTNGIYVPEIISYNNNVKTTAGGVNPRILYSKPISLSGTSSLTGLSYSDIFKVGTYSMSIYPYAGNVNDPLNPTYSINFGGVNSYYRGYIETPENLFVNYYQNQMIDISDKNSRIVTAYFNLNANDISQFRFSDLIIFRVNGADGYYRVNKIIDYDPTVNMTTKVELIRAINYNIPKRITPTSVIGTVYVDPGGIGNISSFMALPGNGSGSGQVSFVTLDGGSGNSAGGNANVFLGDNNASQGSDNIISGDGNQVYGSNNLVIGDGMEITSNMSININDGTNPQLLLSSTGRTLESSTSSYYIFENGTSSTMIGTFSYSETITPTYTLTDRGGVITYTSPRDYNGIIVYDTFSPGTNSIVSNIRFEIDSEGMYGTISTISGGTGLKNYTLKFDINRYLVSSATSNDVISISILPLLRNVLNISGVYNDVLFYYTWFKLKVTNYHYIIGPGNSGYYEYNSLHYLVNGGGGANYLSSLTYSNNSGNNLLLYPNISTTGNYFVHENVYATYSSFTMNTTYELSGTIAYD